MTRGALFRRFSGLLLCLSLLAGCSNEEQQAMNIYNQASLLAEGGLNASTAEAQQFAYLTSNRVLGELFSRYPESKIALELRAERALIAGMTLTDFQREIIELKTQAE